MVEDPRKIERNQLKLGLNPNVFAHSVLGGGGGGRAGFSEDFESVSFAHPISLPLAPSRSLFLSFLVPVTLNTEIAWGKETPFLKGADDRD